MLTELPVSGVSHQAFLIVQRALRRNMDQVRARRLRLQAKRSPQAKKKAKARASLSPRGATNMAMAPFSPPARGRKRGPAGSAKSDDGAMTAHVFDDEVVGRL